MCDSPGEIPALRRGSMEGRREFQAQSTGGRAAARDKWAPSRGNADHGRALRKPNAQRVV